MSERSIVITRALPDGQEFGQALQAYLGFDLDLLFEPVIAFEPVAFEIQSLRAPLIFTSKQAIGLFCDQSDLRGEAICVGERVAVMAKSKGFDVSDVYERVRDLAGAIETKATYIRGAEVTFDLKSIHPNLDEVVVYRQVPLALSENGQELFRANAIAPVFSVNSARNLLQSQDTSGWSATFVAISEEVALPLEQVGIKNVVITEHPTRDSMMKSIKQLLLSQKESGA